MNDTTIKPAIRPWLYVALAVIIIDQLSKTYFHVFFVESERVSLLPFLDLTLLFNRGAAFSFLASETGWQRWFFTVLGLIAGIVITWMLHTHRGQRLFSLSLALILGGALGNVIDRVLFAHVVDFILVHWANYWYFPAFNLADTAITLGTVGIIANEVLFKSKKKDKAPTP